MQKNVQENITIYKFAKIPKSLPALIDGIASSSFENSLMKKFSLVKVLLQ